MRALQNLHTQGRTTLLLGAPGCGKSTLMRVLANRLRGCGALNVQGQVRQGRGYQMRFAVWSAATPLNMHRQATPSAALRVRLPRQVLYNGHSKDEIAVERTVAFVEQVRAKHV